MRGGMPAASRCVMATRGSVLVSRLFRPFSKVRHGEGIVVLLMLTCMFLILAS
jgi:hypothetical protein